MVQQMKGKKEMKKTMRTALAGLLLVPVLALGVSVVTSSADVAAQGIKDGVEAVGTTGTEKVELGTIIKNVINGLLYVVGALAVIMLVWGGIRYTTSAGNSNSVSAAKNTILYAIIGLVVAFLAYAIVNWVLDFGTSGTNSFGG